MDPTQKQTTTAKPIVNHESLTFTNSDMPSASSYGESQPSKRWQIVALMLLVIFLAPFMLLLTLLPFILLNDKSDNLMFELILYIYGLPLSGLALLIGSILSVIYLIKYRPSGHSALIPIITILVTMMAAFSILYYFVSSERSAQIMDGIAQVKEDRYNADALRVEAIFKEFGFEGSVTPMAGEDFVSMGYWSEPKYFRYNQVAHGLFKNVEAQLNTHISSLGYIPYVDEEGEPYYISGNSKLYQNGFVVLRYLRDSEVLAIQYRLKDMIKCPEINICSYTPENEVKPNIYPLSNFNSEQIVEFTARYTNTKGSYFSSFNANYYQ